MICSPESAQDARAKYGGRVVHASKMLLVPGEAMRTRTRLATAATAALFVFSAGAFQASAQSPKGAAPVGHNIFGQPDLSGDWSNASITPLTRNRSISDKPSLTAEEAKTYGLIDDIIESRKKRASEVVSS